MTTATTATRDDLVALAPIPLTRPGESTVPVRMQTEHLYAVENHLDQQGIPADVVETYFLGLHRCDELPRDLWVGMITDAYNLAVRTAAAPTYVAAQAIEWASSNTLMRWVNDAPDGPMSYAETVTEYLGEVNPFPDGTRVDVLDHQRDHEADRWTPATIVDRTASDEWTVEFDDGGQVWRDHSELRPHRSTDG